MESGSSSRHDKRKNEIFDCAAGLFYTEGYDKTSIQQIIDSLGIAKGTFYHYFSSKFDLLNQLTLRETDEMVNSINLIVADEKINAVEKNQFLFRYDSKLGNRKLGTDNQLY